MNSLVTYVLLSIFALVSATELEYDGWLQLRLWHAVNNDPVPNFEERGNITVSSIRSPVFAVSQSSLKPYEIEQLKVLAEQDGTYRLRVLVRSSSGSEVVLHSFVRACLLLGSNLEDIISIWLDSAAEPIAVNLYSLGPCSYEDPLSDTWITNVNVKYTESGPIPDTASYIQKLEREREARERGETKDNRSFLAKYWIYIVPALIFVILTSATNPEAGGGGGGGSVQRQ
ncbi:ER membrane protein complex subunit 10 [Orussus abietinus]|uniref:ER membrane protein complex subunit 10 n=1 Tax=Orussus abietinus TaxID=222816 RepID=UPI0006258B60|nr:ER membrane protein complex subunit 10 [Orussus abietinus]